MKYFLIFVLLFLVSFVGATQYNLTDTLDYSLKTCLGANVQPVGISYNDSNFFIMDDYEDSIWIVNDSFCNITSRIDVGDECNANSVRDMDSNGSETWFYDSVDDWYYHLNSSFKNQSDGFSHTYMNGTKSYDQITFNDSNYFLTDGSYNRIYVLNSTFGNVYNITCEWEDEIDEYGCMGIEDIYYYEGYFIILGTGEDIRRINQSGGMLDWFNISSLGFATGGNLNSIVTLDGTTFYLTDYAEDVVHYIYTDMPELPDFNSGGANNEGVGIPSLDEFFGVITGGGSFTEAVESYNPDVYPVLVSYLKAFKEAKDIELFFDNLYSIGLLAVEYAFRQPSSLVVYGGSENV